jgi:aquaporin Z
MTLERKLVMEFVGTFFLVFTVGMAVANAGDFAPLAIGSVLMVMVFAGGHVSGAHYNPAVSTAVFLRGKMTQNELVTYWGTQIVAAVAAGLVVIALGYDADKTADVAGAGKMLIVEFLFTFALAFVVLNVATARGTENNSFYGLAIGFTVLVGALAVGSISGGAFNPAVAVGAMVEGILSWGDFWVYLLADLLGGVAAAAVFLYTQPGEDPRGDRRAAEPGDAAGRGARA